MKLYMKIVIFTLILCILLPITPICMAASPVVNVALGKPIIAASGTTTTFGNFPPEYLTDGDIGTFWYSAYGSDSISWAVIDLEDEYLISHVSLTHRQDMDFPDTRNGVYVEVSNNPNFTGAVERVGMFNDVEFASVTTAYLNGDYYRYVRVAKFGTLVLGEVAVYASQTSFDERVKTIDYKDVEDETLLNKLELITSIGCVKRPITNGIFEPIAETTREEFISMLMAAAMLSMGDPMDEIDGLSDCFDKGALVTAAEMGFISASELSEPQAVITKDSAVKLILDVLDYGHYIMTNERIDYMILARQKNLLSGVSLAQGALLRADAVNLIYNVLHSSRAKPILFSDGYVKYTENSESLLYEKHGIVYMEGVVSANEFTTLNFDGRIASEGGVLIEGVNYRMALGARDSSRFLGQSIRFYFREETMEIVYASPIKKQVLLEIPSEDIISFSNNRYSADVDGKIINYNLLSGADIIYNGKAAARLTEKQYKPEQGIVTLIDRNDDGIFDCVIVSEVKSGLVNSVNHNNELIVYYNMKDSAGNDVMDMIELKNKTYEIYYEGKKVSLSSLNSKDVISVGESLDELHTVIYVSQKKIEGTLLEYSNETIFLEELGEFKYIPSLFEDLNWRLGVNCLVYLNYQNKVVYVDYTTTGMRYAYVTSVTRNSGGLAGKFMLYLYNSTGDGWYTLETLVTIDGKKYTDGRQIESVLKNIFLENGEIKSQMVKYRANTSLRILELCTVKGSLERTDDPDKSKGIYVRYTSTSGDQKWHSGNIFDAAFPFADDTPLFNVSYYGNKYSCKVQTGAVVSNSKTYYITQAFGGDDLEPVEVMLVKSGLGGSTTSDVFGMFDRVSDIVDEFGTENFRIYCYQGGRLQSYELVSAEVLSSVKNYLKKGDAIYMGLDSENRVTSIEFLYNDPLRELPDNVLYKYAVSETTTHTGDGASIYNDNLFVYGYIDKISASGFLRLAEANETVDDGGNIVKGTEYLFNGSSISAIYMYDQSIDKCFVESLSAVKTNQVFGASRHKVVASIGNGYIRALFLFD